MRVLLVGATVFELQPVVGQLLATTLTSRSIHGRVRGHELDVLVTGVGMVATAAWCARTLAECRPDTALNVGVCGSFRAALPPGTVVQVVSERLPELGAQDDEAFLTLQQLGLQDENDAPFRAGRLQYAGPDAFSSLSHLPQVHGVTVNTAHGHEPSIRALTERWDPDVESMEGAAFAFACLTAGVAFAQVRAVSNRVERRNRAGWRIGEALDNLTREIVDAFEDL